MTVPRTSPAADPSLPPSLWDPVVRITHWGIAFAIVTNALVTEGGSLAHVIVGWVVGALLLLRLLWGVLGPFEARFSAFPPRPVAAGAHLLGLLRGGGLQSHPSHNPAGALMAYAFWLSLAAVVASGLVMTGGATPMQVAAEKAAVASGDWSALIDAADGEKEDSGTRKAAEEVHEVMANLLLVLAALHLLGVAVESRAMRRNLVSAMLFGGSARRK